VLFRAPGAGRMPRSRRPISYSGDAPPNRSKATSNLRHRGAPFPEEIRFLGDMMKPEAQDVSWVSTQSIFRKLLYQGVIPAHGEDFEIHAHLPSNTFLLLQEFYPCLQACCRSVGNPY